MILFVNDNNGFLFLKSIVDVISNAYKNLRQLVPSTENVLLGMMMENGDVYCRVDVDRYHIKYNDNTMKYITYLNTLSYAYNCMICGYRITITNHRWRYKKWFKFGKGFN